MKKLMLIAVLTALTLAAGEIAAQEAAKVEVVKFKWAMYDRSAELDASTIFNEKTTGLPPGRNNQLREKTIEEQSRDLARIETVARKDARDGAARNFFVYELKIKNLDEKTIKSFVWEYPADGGGGGNSSFLSASNRRFLCVGKIKPGDSRTLRFISHLPPGSVVDASSAGISNNETGKSLAAAVIINRVGFADGTVWKKAGLNESAADDAALDSPRVLAKLKFSECAAL
jgi:hypothetical protein